MTTTDAVDDFFAQPAAPVERRPEPKRDRWGRYVLAHPQTGKTGPWTRATTFAKSISDTFALSQWGARMTLKGAAMRPDLTAMAVTLDVKRDRDTLNGLVEQAKDAAGQKVSANLGTALHALTEARDSGQQVDIPAVHQADVDAYTAALRTAGIEIVPHLIERVTCIPQWADGQALGVAGTFDRIVRLPDGTYAIGDLKTGADLQYGWQEIAIQLAIYAHGVNTSGVWDYDAGQWQQTGPDEPGVAPLPQVRTDFGIVMHLPVGNATCTLYKVDLRQGWEGAEMCAAVRAWRSRRALAEPLTVAAPAAVREPTWQERFRAASSRGELSRLYAGAVEAGIRGAELAGLVDVGTQRLRELTEPAG